MKLEFLGTRGEIEPKSRRHRRHSSMIVAYRGSRVMIDCGSDWLDKVFNIRPDAIILTHAHPDHAFGLENGAPCPVYAPARVWDNLPDYPLENRHHIAIERKRDIKGISFKAFTVEHSIKAPAVGYKISAGKATVFYVPDLVYIHKREKALRNVQIYIGDGATLTRSFIRKRDDSLIGHAPIRTQLTWCGKEGVPQAIITHNGSEVVAGDERKLGKKLRDMARERGVKARFAYDGLKITLP